MVAKPSIAVSHVEEIFRDDLGQYWSPAQVTLTWPPLTDISGPSLVVNVVASSRPDMTLEQLYKAHLSAAHDVLSAALLAMEEPVLEAQTDMRSSPYRVNAQDMGVRDVSRDGSSAAKK
jgi:hypothetical protein